MREDQAEPLPVARVAVALVTHTLPAPADRRRYRAEFLADLSGLPPAEQRRYCAGILAQAFAERRALGTSSQHFGELRMDSYPTVWQSFRCHVLRIHYGHTYSTDDGSRYVACAVCRKEHPGTGSWPGGMGGLDSGV